MASVLLKEHLLLLQSRSLMIDPMRGLLPDQQPSISEVRIGLTTPLLLTLNYSKLSIEKS